MKRSLSAFLAAMLCLLLLAGYLPFATSGMIGAAEAPAYSAGDTIAFGSYPQSMVTEETLLAALNAQQLSWQSYGYYSGNGSIGSAAPSDFMQFADVTYQGAAYRAVRFSQYRPPIAYWAFSANTTGYQSYPIDGSRSAYFQKDTVYWFAYEPLLWRVINPATGLLIADRILDAQPYQNAIYAAEGNYYADVACTIGANDYAHSSVRAWLTGPFCQTAFSAQEAACITPTTLQIIPYQTVLYDPIENQTAFLFSANATDNMYFYQRYGVTAFYAQSDRAPSLYAYMQGARERYDYPLLRGKLSESDISYVCEVGHSQINPSQFSAIRPGICIDLEKYDRLQASTPIEPDTSALQTLLNDAAAIDRTLYTDASLAALDAAVSAAGAAAESNDQAQINSAANALQSALNNLKRRANDAALREAQAQAAAIDRALYTADSLTALDAALAAAPEQADITQQAAVDESAAAIRAALEALAYLPADYTAVDAAIAQANALDLTRYSDSSSAAVRTAVAAVDRTLNCTQQAQADAYAAAILDAIDRLAYAAVILRHEATGVIVSGTTLELDRSTALAVDLVDPADHEGANYAVGGKIKSLTFYDINLLLGGQRVQPAGMVTVRIRLQDGVDPAKCKVYHVTDDLVNPLVRFANTIDGNYVVFQTDHFSEFAIIEVETVLDHIEIASAPAQTTYALGETFRPAGLSVRACFSDGTSESVTDYELAAVSTDTLGQKKVTVYYTHKDITKSASFFIQVVAPAGSYHIALRTPSVTALRYGETLMLYTVGDLPRGASIKWVYDGKGLKLTPTEDTKCCAVYSNGTGEGRVTAYVVDAAGNKLTDANGKPVSASVALTSNGSFIQRMVSFLKNLFHVNRRIDY